MKDSELRKLTEPFEVVAQEADEGLYFIREVNAYHSISGLAKITGHDRRTVTERVQDLHYRNGPNRSKLYLAPVALRAVCGGNRGW